MKSILIFFFIYFSLMADSNATKENITFIENITSGYHSFLNSIDCFLANCDDFNQSNYKKISEKNKLHLILSLKKSQDKIQKDIHIRARIKLPQLQDKFELTFSKQAEKRMDNQHINDEYEDILKDNKLHVGLKYYIYKEPFSIAYTKFSLRVHSPVGFYAKIGLSKSYFYKKLEIIFDNVLYYYLQEQEYSLSASLIYFLPLGNRYEIEQKNQWYKDGGDKTSIFERTLALYDSINATNKLQYQLAYATIDNELCNYCKDWYGVNIKFRHLVNKWFFFEMIPELIKKRENNFELEKLFTINFGITFSK